MIVNPGMSEEKKDSVTSFNGRSGIVTPSSGDYSVDQVTGAAPKESPVFTGSISLGRLSSASVGAKSSAVGVECTASELCSHAEGYKTTASGESSHAEGHETIASGLYSHAEGDKTKASGSRSHAEGRETTASAEGSHAGGIGTVAGGYASVAIGQYTNAERPNQLAMGTYNKNVSTYDVFTIGSGSKNALSNCFRIEWASGYVYARAFNPSGADYAELFEWLDGNPESADLCGRFVTLDGEKIRLAGPGDDFILGIVSGNPSVVGDVHDDQWQGMYLYDIFGRPLWEDVEVPDVTEEEPDPEDPGSTVTRVIIPAHIEHRQRLNPAYDGSQPYLPRTQRPEWDAVGMLGKLVAVDDGTCQAGGWCTVGEGGAATHSAARTRYRVMARLDESHVRVLIL